MHYIHFLGVVKATPLVQCIHHLMSPGLNTEVLAVSVSSPLINVWEGAGSRFKVEVLHTRPSKEIMLRVKVPRPL